MKKELKRSKRRESQKKSNDKRDPFLAIVDKHKVKEKAKERRMLLKKTVFDHYGNKCACCGESIKDFLSVDHVYNDGAEHRKEVGSGSKLYKWLIDNDFPDGFQLLCRNCNWGKHVNNGICPHKA